MELDKVSSQLRGSNGRTSSLENRVTQKENHSSSIESSHYVWDETIISDIYNIQASSYYYLML